MVIILSDQAEPPGTVISPTPPAEAVPVPGPGQIVPGPPGVGGPLLQRNLVRLSEEALPTPVGGSPISKFTKNIVAPLPIIYFAENPFTSELLQILAMRLGPRSVAFQADVVPETTIISYNPFGGAPIIELGGDFEIPGAEGRMISSLRFSQAKRVGNSPVP